jgi:hypothetical protein
MKKTGKTTPKKARAADPRGKSKRRCGGATRTKSPRLACTEEGCAELPDGRGIYYHESNSATGIVTTFGPYPVVDEDGASCCLMKFQNSKEGIWWTSYGPDTTLLRGYTAKTAMQGRWDDPASMSLLRALESVRDHPERMADIDGATLRGAVLDFTPEGEARLNAARRAMKAGGLVRGNELSRPRRIAQAVTEAAKINDRPPSAMEVLKLFNDSELARDPTLEVLDVRTFYRDLKNSGWSWLLA